MKDQTQKARDLFFQTELTQAEIARLIGVTTRTLYRWIKQFEWKRIKAAARQAPAAIVERLYMQLLDLNDDICSRPAGSRIPTLQEAELNRKLIVSIGKLKQQVSRSETIQVLTNYTSFIAAQNIEHAHLATRYADNYLQGAFKNGHQPYELEYELNEPEDEIAENVPEPDTAAQPTEKQSVANTPEQTGTPTPVTPDAENPMSPTDTPAPPSPGPEAPPVQPPVSAPAETYDPGITPLEYFKFKSLLHRPCTNTRQTILFKGEVINQMAFEYNLRQMSLPPAQRRYLTEKQFLDQYHKK